MTIFSSPEWITIRNGEFYKGGKPYHFLGTNLWYGLNLGSEGIGGDRARLVRELDRLQSIGVMNLRVMGCSEGPDLQPWRMVPALRRTPKDYNHKIGEGLDFLLHQMAIRGMHAVVCLTNFWPWSGGMAQYLRWNGGAKIPYPPPAPDGNWWNYMTYTSGFFHSAPAQEMFEETVRTIVSRVNHITDVPYADDPSIMSWELCNEPRCIGDKHAIGKWADKTANLIKSIDKNHLVALGSEGNTQSELSGTDFLLDHASPNIDYTTMHLWVQNWEWFDPTLGKDGLPTAFKHAEKYITEHTRLAGKLGKPIVLEEFGISRDANSHDVNAPTSVRDDYYKFVFGLAHRLASEGTALKGMNFWAWGGEGRPSAPEALWKPGDDFIGDPPHEHQGWYSVFDTDKSTLEVIDAFAKKFEVLGKKQ